MLDRNLVANNLETVLEQLHKRHASEDMLSEMNKLSAVIARRRELQTKTDELRSSRKKLSKQIGGLMREKRMDEVDAIKAEVTTIGNRLDLLEDERKDLQKQEDDLLHAFPNLLDARVPEGTSEEDNELIETWGTPRTFDFEPKEHHILGEEMGLYDAERAAKIAGARFSILKGDLARLERALIQFFLDTAEDNGYTEVLVPYIVNRDSMTGTGQLPKFEEDLFKLTSEIGGMDGFLIPTAEVPVTNMFRDEILNEEDLPIHLCAFTPCFRAEAGTYGKDTHGLIRQHQFHKVELVKITKPEHSDAEHHSLTDHACGILQALGLPYRKMRLCAGDTSFSAQLCYDLEVWLPGQNKYREISSCSNFGEFQARRMKTRFRSKGEKKPKLCHTINGSGLAVGRTLVAIMENYQQDDGSVDIPTVLQPYMRGKTKITLQD